MSVSELLRNPPVSYSNLDVISVDAKVVNSNALYLGGAVNTFTGASGTLTPSQIVSGVAGFTFSGATNWSLPSSSVLTSFFGASIPSRFYFKFQASAYVGCTLTLSIGSGMANFGGGNTVSIGAGFAQKDVVFFWDGSVWRVYF